MAVSTGATRCTYAGRTVLAHILSLAGLMALVRLTGFAEKQILAARFGATFTMDVYFIALSLPMMVFFSATALLSPTFQPVFLRRMEEGAEQRAWLQFRAWRTLGLCVLCAVAGGAALGAERLAAWLGPGLDPEHRIACAQLIRILSPAAVVMGLLPLTSAVLNGRRRFTVPPLADIAVRACTMVGEGRELTNLRSLAQKLGIASHVFFAGPLPHEQVLCLYADADVLVAPSVVAANGDRDGIPNVVLEAMARGVPVVATSVGAIPEVLKDGLTGLLVAPRNSRQLADAIGMVLREPALGARIAGGARGVIRAEFSPDFWLTRLRKLFD